MSYNANNGYVGYSMSVRASLAYADGERPFSKWNKKDVIELVYALDQSSQWKNFDLNKISAQTIKEFFLEKTSWHHTSKCFNETSFYSVDEEAVLEYDFNRLLKLEELNQQIKEEEKAAKAAKQATQKLIKAHIIYEEWQGSRNYGRYVKVESYAIVADDWAYLENGKKKLGGKHIINVVEFNRAPKGTAEIFKRIEKSLPSKYRK